MTDIAIRTTGLCYRYRRGPDILNNIGLSVPSGAIYGFLGPNGSGKTTTLSLLLGLIGPRCGSIEVFGRALGPHRREIMRGTGSLIESPSLYPHLNARENLEVYRRVYELPKKAIEEALQLVGLTDTASKPVKRFSLGMKQRLAIALALLPGPKLLILDEPTNGLDPAGIIELRLLMQQLNQAGMTILVSSHILAEVEKLASHLGIITAGKLVFQGPMAGLRELQKRQSLLHIRTSDDRAACDVLANDTPQLTADGLQVPQPADAAIAAINRRLLAAGLDVYALSPRPMSLEQLFIDLTETP